MSVFQGMVVFQGVVVHCKGNAELVLSLDGLEGTRRGGSQVSINPLSIDCALFLLLVALTRYGRDSSRHSFP